MAPRRKAGAICLHASTPAAHSGSRSSFIILALCGIAAALSDSWLIARWFTLSLCVILLFILGLTAGLLRTLRYLLDKTRLHLPSFLRHGLANLYRPGNQSKAVLSALGVGVMLILAVFLMQRSMIHDMQMTLGSGVPNVFMIDISTDELPGLQKLLAAQPGVKGNIEALPIISGRLTQIDGVDAASMIRPKAFPAAPAAIHAAHLVGRCAPPVSRSRPAAGGRPAHVTSLPSMKTWPSASTSSSARSWRFAVNDQNVPATVAAFFRSDGQHVNARSEFVLSKDALQGMPTVNGMALRMRCRNRSARVQAAIFAGFPTITVINIADVVETIQGVVKQITIVIRFLAGFSILAGMVILASSIASTRYRRIREVVVLKTLGAKRIRIAGIFAVEFLMLGSLAGLVGTVFANLLTTQLLHRMDVTFHASWWANLLGVGGTALLAVATGWLASARILEQRPLEVLREE